MRNAPPIALNPFEISLGSFASGFLNFRDSKVHHITSGFSNISDPRGIPMSSTKIANPT